MKSRVSPGRAAERRRYDKGGGGRIENTKGRPVHVYLDSYHNTLKYETIIHAPPLVSYIGHYSALWHRSPS